MDKDPVFGYYADFHSAAPEEVVQQAVPVAMQQRLDLGCRLVPTLLQGRLASVLGDDDVGGIQLAVADNLHRGNPRDLLTHQLEDGAAEVAGDTAVGPRAAQPIAQEGVVESLSARGEAA